MPTSRTSNAVGSSRWSADRVGVVRPAHCTALGKVILAAISLDLFAVLLGGAVTLLPVYATDILHVGPEGLGLMRAARLEVSRFRYALTSPPSSSPMVGTGAMMRSLLPSVRGRSSQRRSGSRPLLSSRSRLGTNT